MDLYVVRHAIAEERRPDLVDASRALTKSGRKRFARCVAGLERLELRFDRVLHSPWRRAAQTAELMTSLGRAIEPHEALAAPPSRGLLEVLGEAGETVAVVGHEPWLSELIAWLVVGEPADGDARFRMKKGGVAQLRGTPRPGRMQLRALLPPKLFLE
ncbi:MAG: phosphohistidine phosphatase SixA [Sandaracinaceae bacterium]|nr:MAG: phosphohistidine phosphatase SixA [Sandaracinaceae bacterium]